LHFIKTKSNLNLNRDTEPKYNDYNISDISGKLSRERVIFLATLPQTLFSSFPLPHSTYFKGFLQRSNSVSDCFSSWWSEM